VSGNDNAQPSVDTAGLAAEIAKLEQEAIKAALEAYPPGVPGNPAPIVMAARMQALEGIVCSVIAQLEAERAVGDAIDINVRTLRELRDYWKNIPPGVAKLVDDIRAAMKAAPGIVKATGPLPPMRPR
jgi:hypothetical protein